MAYWNAIKSLIQYGGSNDMGSFQVLHIKYSSQIQNNCIALIIVV